MELEKMNRNELREACREHGIKYGPLGTVGAMRRALAAVVKKEIVAVGDLAKDADAYFEHFGGDEGYNLDQDPTPEMGEEAIPLPEPKVEAKVFADANNNGAGARLLNTPEARRQYEEEVVKPAQAARESRNGVKRPVKGVCADIWNALDGWHAQGMENKDLGKAIRELAVREGWNANNVSIELSAWRKFHGRMLQPKK